MTGELGFIDDLNSPARCLIPEGIRRLSTRHFHSKMPTLWVVSDLKIPAEIEKERDREILTFLGSEHTPISTADKASGGTDD